MKKISPLSLSAICISAICLFMSTATFAEQKTETTNTALSVGAKTNQPVEANTPDKKDKPETVIDSNDATASPECQQCHSLKTQEDEV
ncbi:MAG: hypothetical protein COA42_19810 [Alteromonadaceae bacterium]|nr:MAG: hypothetical protein COA42_19810 [Alteromonadaceae bacterium]